MIVCVAYRPPNCPVSCFKDDFTPVLTQALTLGNAILVTGDLNCNLLSDSPDSCALRELANYFNLTQLISKPTRVTEKSSTLIDIILISDKDLICHSDVMPIAISDHFLVYAVLAI